MENDMQASVTERVSPPRAVRLPRHVRMLLRMGRRQLPAAQCGVAVEHGIEVPAGDGALMLTDHYRPLIAGQRPTLLVRTPYGRGFPWDYVYGALFARQGFHVLIQSCRGTGGSGGEVEPFLHDVADAQAAVAWIRRQDWFNGALGTIGASYLGYTQWALATDPPPELLAMVIQVGSDDFFGVQYPGGAFAVEAMLMAMTATLTMEHGFGRFLLAMLRLMHRIKRAERTLPFIDAYPAVFGKRVGYFEEWIARPVADDPYWTARRAAVRAESVPPTSLLTGWWDICLDPTLAAYRRLRAAGREVRLVVGPWNHASGFNDDMPALLGEALGWLRAHLEDDGSSLPRQPVRVHVGATGGRGRWRDLADWPPPDARQQQWHLQNDGTLAAGAPSRTAAPAVSSFRYDPAAPTPSVGGPSLNSRAFGSRRNNAIEARDDVLVFTSAPLPAPLEVIGPVSIRLSARGSGQNFDVFARLCDVDERGRSWNVCDGLVRLGEQTGVAPAGTTASAAPGHASAAGAGHGPWQEVTVPMSATAHRFGAGHRLRVQICGGAHPRYARNTGTAEPWATATRLVAVDIEIGHEQPCVLSLLVVEPGTDADLAENSFRQDWLSWGWRCQENDCMTEDKDSTQGAAAAAAGYVVTAATAVAAGRVALGLVALAWPAVPARPWVGASADGTAARVFGRALGGRDLALGIGALAALRQPRSAPAWLAAGALSDAFDVVATAAAWSQLPPRTRWLVAASASGAALAGAAGAIAATGH
jgi:uncharacterized protein